MQSFLGFQAHIHACKGAENYFYGAARTKCETLHVNSLEYIVIDGNLQAVRGIN